jgi:hypothetical protein
MATTVANFLNTVPSSIISATATPFLYLTMTIPQFYTSSWTVAPTWTPETTMSAKMFLSTAPAGASCTFSWLNSTNSSFLYSYYNSTCSSNTTSSTATVAQMQKFDTVTFTDNGTLFFILNAATAPQIGFTAAQVNNMFANLLMGPFMFNFVNASMWFVSFPTISSLSQYSVIVSDNSTTGWNYTCNVMLNNKEAVCLNVSAGVVIINVTISKGVDIIAQVQNPTNTTTLWRQTFVIILPAVLVVPVNTITPGTPLSYGLFLPNSAPINITKQAFDFTFLKTGNKKVKKSTVNISDYSCNTSYGLMV